MPWTGLYGQVAGDSQRKMGFDFSGPGILIGAVHGLSCVTERARTGVLEGDIFMSDFALAPSVVYRLKAKKCSFTFLGDFFTHDLNTCYTCRLM